MNRKMVRDDPALEQVFDVYLLLQRLDNDRLMLCTVELVKHVGGVALELCTAIVHGKTAINFKDLSHEVNHRVIKVHDDHQGVCASILLLKVFRSVHLGEDGVIDASTTN